MRVITMKGIAMKRSIPLLLIVLCAGCGSVGEHSKNESLQTTLLAYANVIRWGEIEEAVKYVDPQTLKDHPLTSIDMERYKQVRVASYNEQPPVPAGSGEILQVVKIDLININTQTERTIVDKQIWRYDEKSKHWHVVSGLPDITQH
jgi:hypothetical protein